MSTAARLVRVGSRHGLHAGVERDMRSPPESHKREFGPEGSKGCFYHSGISFETHRTEGQ